MFVGSASALVTIGQTTSAVGPLDINDTFDVQILLTWDGNATTGLTGIFASHQWSNTQLALTNATFTAGTMTFETRPTPLKGTSYDPALSRLGTIAAGIAGDDLTQTARTVQYAQGARRRCP
jgi:hypothetical protein